MATIYPAILDSLHVYQGQQLETSNFLILNTSKLSSFINKIDNFQYKAGCIRSAIYFFSYLVARCPPLTQSGCVYQGPPSPGGQISKKVPLCITCLELTMTISHWWHQSLT